MERRLHSSRKSGFALLASMAASAVVGAILMTVGSMVQNASKFQRNLSSVGDLDELKGLISLVLSNQSACSRIFAKKTFNPDPKSLNQQKVTGIAITSPANAAKILAQAGLSLNATTVINDVFLSNIMENGTDRYIARLNIQTSPAGSKSGLTVTRGLYIGINTSLKNTTTAEIANCYSPGDSFGTPDPSRPYFLGSLAQFRPPTSTTLSINYPLGTKFIIARAQTNFVARDDWTSEDTTTFDLTIDIRNNTSNGTLSHTGGNGSAQTLMAIWNNEAFGKNVSLTGDLYASGYGLSPITVGPKLTRTGNQITFSDLPAGSQDAWLFQFLGD